jgi:hypothetical protein
MLARAGAALDRVAAKHPRLAGVQVVAEIGCRDSTVSVLEANVHSEDVAYALYSRLELGRSPRMYGLNASNLQYGLRQTTTPFESWSDITAVFKEAFDRDGFKSIHRCSVNLRETYIARSDLVRSIIDTIPHRSLITHPING